MYERLRPCEVLRAVPTGSTDQWAIMLQNSAQRISHSVPMDC